MLWRLQADALVQCIVWCHRRCGTGHLCHQPDSLWAISGQQPDAEHFCHGHWRRCAGYTGIPVPGTGYFSGLRMCGCAGSVYTGNLYTGIFFCGLLVCAAGLRTAVWHYRRAVPQACLPAGNRIFRYSGRIGADRSAGCFLTGCRHPVGLCAHHCRLSGAAVSAAAYGRESGAGIAAYQSQSAGCGGGTQGRTGRH